MRFSLIKEKKNLKKHIQCTLLRESLGYDCELKIKSEKFIRKQVE